MEITDEMFIIPSETAEAFLQIQEQLRQAETKTKKDAGSGSETGRKDVSGIVSSPGEGSDDDIEIIGPGPVLPIKKKTKAEWLGEIPSQKWMNFYIKVLSKFAARNNLKLTSNLKISNPKGISEQKIEEMQAALRDLGLEDELEFNNE